MVSTQHTQSLTDFRQNATETLDRLRKTKEAEIITVNGEAKAVIMAPELYDAMARELELLRDVESMRKSLEDIKAGRVVTVEEASRQIRAKIAEVAAQKSRGGQR